MGTSAAFHLAEAGVEVVLLERAQLGSGSTSRAAGGVRAQFSDALNIQIAQRSLEAFTAFATRPGWEIDLKRSGYLFVLSREADMAEFEASVALQNCHGVPSRMLGGDEARALCPLLAGDDILGASFSPDDGHATPEAVVQGYAFAARALGAHLRVGCEVTGIETDGERITAVRTTDGIVATGVVICAAGAWSRACGEMVGVTLPVTPVRRQILFTEPMDDPGRSAIHHRLRLELLFSPGGAGAADGDVAHGRAAGVRSGDHRRLGPGSPRGRIAPGASHRRGRNQGRLGGALRGHA